MANSLFANRCKHDTISADRRHTIGLKTDGTVVAIGDNKCGQCNISEWRDIIAVAAGSVQYGNKHG